MLLSFHHKKNNTFIGMIKIPQCIIFLFIFVFATISSPAQKHDKKLEKKIRELLKGFHGDAGVYVHDLKKIK
jgi:beta-lactamase class A